MVSMLTAQTYLCVSRCAAASKIVREMPPQRPVMGGLERLGTGAACRNRWCLTLCRSRTRRGGSTVVAVVGRPLPWWGPHRPRPCSLNPMTRSASQRYNGPCSSTRCIRNKSTVGCWPEDHCQYIYSSVSTSEDRNNGRLLPKELHCIKIDHANSYDGPGTSAC